MAKHRYRNKHRRPKQFKKYNTKEMLPENSNQMNNNAFGHQIYFSLFLLGEKIAPNH